MKRSMSVLMSIAISLAIAACSTPAGAPASQSLLGPASSQPADPGGTATQPAGGATPSAVLSTSATNLPAPPEPPTSEPPTADLEYRVTYDWAVPSNQVTIPNAVHAPIAPAPALPLPYLVAVYVGDHPEANPKYQRTSFYFRGAFPEYNLQYVPSLTAEGSGATIPLEGNAVLQVGFVSAQAHDNTGASTVKATPKNPIGFQNLKSYGFAGDYEGYVTYGLGIQAAPESDQVLQIRASELKKPDGAGGFYYVVHVDVQNGCWFDLGDC
jgi:hypothetical protein